MSAKQGMQKWSHMKKNKYGYIYDFSLEQDTF